MQHTVARPAVAERLAITDSSRIPAARYYDADFFEAEAKHLWPHVWQMACRLEQIPEEGDWVEYQNLGRSVIVVNAGEGSVKAWHNACRHRGVPIAGSPGRHGAERSNYGNCKAHGFVCPFHGWRYDMHGENTFVYGRQLFEERQLAAAEINLVPCRVETAIGCAFINFDDEAPSFRETIGPLIGRLEAHRVDRLRAEWWYATVLPANWKTAMEAFMEGYHVRATHPQLHHCLPAFYDSLYEQKGGSNSAADSLAAQSFDGMTRLQAIDTQIAHLELIGQGMGGQVHAKELAIARSLRDADLPDDPAVAVPQWYGLVQAEITRRLGERGEPVPDLNAVGVSDPLQGVEFMFPNYFLLPVFSSMSSYRVRPISPESCLFELWSLTTYPEGQQPEPVMEPVLLPFDSQDFPPIPRQDYANIPIQQIGLHAKGFEFMRLSRSVEGLVSNYQRLIDGYLSGVPVSSLGKATQALGGNFDGPIKDLGF